METAVTNIETTCFIEILHIVMSSGILCNWRKPGIVLAKL